MSINLGFLDTFIVGSMQGCKSLALNKDRNPPPLKNNKEHVFKKENQIKILN